MAARETLAQFRRAGQTGVWCPVMARAASPGSGNRWRPSAP